MLVHLVCDLSSLLNLGAKFEHGKHNYGAIRCNLLRHLSRQTICFASADQLILASHKTAVFLEKVGNVDGNNTQVSGFSPIARGYLFFLRFN